MLSSSMKLGPGGLEHSGFKMFILDLTVIFKRIPGEQFEQLEIRYGKVCVNTM